MEQGVTTFTIISTNLMYSFKDHMMATYLVLLNSLVQIYNCMALLIVALIAACVE